MYHEIHVAANKQIPFVLVNGSLLTLEAQGKDAEEWSDIYEERQHYETRAWHWGSQQNATEAHSGI